MGIEGLIRSKIYKEYKAWVFVKDWILAFILMFMFTFVMTIIVFLGSSFVDGTWVDWFYFKENGWWYFRLYTLISFTISFFLEIYLFPDSYKCTLKDLKEGK